MNIMRTFEIFLSLPKSIIKQKVIQILHIETNFFEKSSSMSVDFLDDIHQITIKNNKPVYHLLTTVMYKRKLLYESKKSKISNKCTVA